MEEDYKVITELIDNTVLRTALVRQVCEVNVYASLVKDPPCANYISLTNPPSL